AGAQTESRMDDIRPSNDGISKASKGGRHQNVAARRRAAIVSPRPSGVEARVRKNGVLVSFPGTMAVVAVLTNNPAGIRIDHLSISAPHRSRVGNRKTSPRAKTRTGAASCAGFRGPKRLATGCAQSGSSGRNRVSDG